MLLLAIETSTARSSVALADERAVLASMSLGLPRRHGEFVAPAIATCLEQIGRRAADVTGVAVGLGPGLYTGLRVGIATAQAIAAAAQVPVVGLTSLDVLAFQGRHVRRSICTAIDGRRDEVFWSFYRSVPGGVQRLTEHQVGRADALAAEIAGRGEDCLVIGDGGVRHRETFEEADAEVAGPDTAWPDAADLAHLARPRFVREETGRPTDLRPVYLRQADARIGWQQRGRMRGGAGGR